MQIDQKTLEQITQLVVNATIKCLEERGWIGKPPVSERSAYAKTEALLYNYNNFKKIVAERHKEIKELREYGVPGTCGDVKEYVDRGGAVQGLVLEEERVEAAVHSVECAIEGTVQAITLIDKSMAALSNDPYYRVLEMRYFDGMTQEDIAVEFECSHVTISKQRSRLVKELSMRIFPNQVVQEMLN